MSNLHEQLKNKLQQVRLSREEHVRMRERLEEYMSFKPLRERQAKPVLARRTFLGDVLHLMHTRYLPAALVVLLAFGGSISFAAESSVPGETLYPLKVNFNEEVVSAFSFTQEAKAQWDARRAERRLEEAGTLAVRGTLDEKTSAEVAERFAVHAESATKRTEEIEKSDPATAAEVGTEFNTALEAQEAILARLSVEGEEHDDVRALMQNIRSKSKDLARVLAAAESDILGEALAAAGHATSSATSAAIGTGSATQKIDESTPQSKSVAQRMQRAAQDRLVEAEELLARAQGDVEAEMLTRSREQLALARTHIARGNEQLSADANAAAYVQFKEAVTIAQKLTRFLRAQAAYRIDILPIDLLPEEPDGTGMAQEPRSGLIDTSETSAQEVARQIPETLEKQEEAEQTLQRAREEFTAARNRAQDVAKEAVEKLKEAEALMVRGEVAFESDDFDDAYRFFRRATILAADAFDLLAAGSKDLPVPDATPPETPAPVPEAATTSATTSSESLLIRHTFENGTHVYTGSLMTPTPCYSVSAAAHIAESLPEHINIDITRVAWSPLCLQQKSEKTFTVEVSASEAARLWGVRVNGARVPFKLEGGASQSSNASSTQAQQQAAAEGNATAAPNGNGGVGAGTSSSARVEQRKQAGAGADAPAASSAAVDLSAQTTQTIDASL